jgi:hypothetical protein
LSHLASNPASPTIVGDQTKKIREWPESPGDWLLSTGEQLVSALAAIQKKCELVNVTIELLKNFNGIIIIKGGGKFFITSIRCPNISLFYQITSCKI